MMKGKKFGVLALSLVLMLAIALLGGCGEEKEYGISPTATNFIAGKTSDLVFILGKDMGEGELSADGSPAQEGQYEVKDGQLILKESYLAALSMGKHAFRYASGGREAAFEVTCYRDITLDRDRIAFDWDNPADIELGIDLGGAAFLSLSMGGEALKASQFTLAEGKLTIKRAAVESLCSDGENLFTAATTVTSKDFVIDCFYSETLPTFDPERLKVQSGNGSDVSFRFNPYGHAFTVSAWDPAAENYLPMKESDYSYGAKSLKISAAYLDGRLAEIQRFRVETQDENQTAYSFAAVPYGKKDSAHPVTSDAFSVNDFETLAPGSSFCGTDVLKDAFYTQGSAQSIVENGIEGKSLSISSVENANINTVLGVNFGFKKDVTYYFEFRYRLGENAAGKTEAVFKWSGVQNAGEDNFLWMKADGSVKSKSDSRTSASFDADTGVVSVRIFTRNTVAGNVFQILTIGGKEVYQIQLDDMRILKTSIPASLDYTPETSYRYNRKGGEDLAVDAQITGSYELADVFLGTTALIREIDYTVSPTGDVLLKAAWLAKQTDFTLILKRTFVKDILGTRAEQSAEITVEVLDKMPGSLTGDAFKAQTQAGQALTYSIATGDLTFSKVTCGSAELGAEHYEYVDGTLTLKASYLSGLTAGIYEYEFVLSDGSSIPFYAAAYGSAEKHLVEGLTQNFVNYPAGTGLGEIYDPAALNSLTGQDAVSVVPDKDFGKALRIPADKTGAGFLNIRTLRPNIVYVIRLRFKVEGDAAIGNLLMKWPAAAIDNSWIQNGVLRSDVDNDDLRSSLVKDGDTGIYTWTAYAKPGTQAGDSLLYWSLTEIGLTVGSLEVIETDLSFVPRGSHYTFRYLSNEDSYVDKSTVTCFDPTQPLVLCNNLNSAGFELEGVFDGETALVSGTDYRTDDGLTLLPAYLGKMTGSIALTVRRRIACLDGSYLEQSAAVTVVIAEGSGFSGRALKNQTGPEDDLSYDLVTGTYGILSVKRGNTPLTAEDYLYEGEKFYLKKSYLSGLSMGMHTFTVEVSDGNFYEIYAGVYGGAETHLANLGTQNFKGYEVGTAMTAIFDQTIVDSVTGPADIKVVADDAFGRALQIPQSKSGGGQLWFKNFQKDRVYRLVLKFKTGGDADIGSLLLKWDKSAIDSSWIENNGLRADGNSDLRSRLTRDESTKIWTWEAYLKPATQPGDSILLYGVQPQEMIIGYLEINETDLAFAEGSTYNYYDGSAFVNTGTVAFSEESAELLIVENINVPAPFLLEGVFAGETKLTEGTDYTKSGAQILLKPSYLGTIAESATLTLKRYAVRLDGSRACQTAEVTVARQTQA